MSAAVTPGGLPIAPAVLQLDVPVMFAAALACLPISFTHGRISRLEGALLLGAYVAYTTYLVLNARQHPLLEPVGAILVWILLPAAGLLLAVSTLRHVRRRGRLRHDTALAPD